MNEYIAALVDELHNLGVRDVVFSPGSRCTAMSMLFTEHGGFRTYMNVDERSAAFFGLGISRVKAEPAVLVCTSGSAMMHYGPAVVEAKYSGIPLIILTADRPPRLRNVGAPQTMDQQKLFGTAVTYYEELSIPGESIRYTYPRQVIQRAYMHAMSDGKGPVHINVPLEEPLVPDLDRRHFERGRRPFRTVRGITAPVDTHILGDMLHERSVLILAGPGSGTDGADGEAILNLARRLQAPVVADPLSNMRRFDDARIIDGYDAFLANADCLDSLKPQCIIQLGRIPVSKRIQQAVAGWHDADYIEVNPHGAYRNPSLTTTVYVQAGIAGFCEAIRSVAGDARLLWAWQAVNEKTRNILDGAAGEAELFEGATVQHIQALIPSYGRILSANSMSIRDMDYFWRGGRSSAWVYGNRGVNGIDGSVSTALGMEAGGGDDCGPTVLLTGDLSFFHDLNGLAVAKTHGLNLTVVLHNNDGGGIFEYLPQRDAPHFEYLFSTAQGLRYDALELLYGIGYTRIEDYERFDSEFNRCMSHPGVHLLEVSTDKKRSRALRKKYTTV